MIYTKPEITSLASASQAIQSSHQKDVMPTLDSTQEAYLTNSAYEADE